MGKNIIIVLLMLIMMASMANPSDPVWSFRQFDNDKHVCSLYIYTDPFLWRQVYKLEDNNATATYRRIRRLITRSVREANKVYNMAEFYGKGHTIHKGIEFDLTDYFIDTDLNCGPPKRQTPWNFHEMDCEEPNVPMVDLCSIKPKCRVKSSVFCNDIRSMRFFLHAFSSMRHDKHCLAFAFTYREMSDFQGIAWIKGHNQNDSRTMDHFGYCANDDAKMCQNIHQQQDTSKDDRGSSATWPEHYFRNTGVVNLHLIRGVLSEQSAVHIFKHELGHSLGARHDDESEECAKKTDEVFLMTAEAKKIVLGQTSKHLSACSSLQIGLNLDQSTCWSQRVGAKKVCNKEKNLKNHRRCLDNIPEKIMDFMVSVFYTAIAALMLIISLLTCIICIYRKCQGKLSKSRSITLLAGRRRSPVHLIRSSQSCQDANILLQPNHGASYARISKNRAGDWLVHDPELVEDGESAQTI